jgi:Lhr-like helicase
MISTNISPINNSESIDSSNKTPPKQVSEQFKLDMHVVEVDGLHRYYIYTFTSLSSPLIFIFRSLPNVRHHFEYTKGNDKLSLLKGLLGKSGVKRTLIFCNTIDSCRAVDYAINEDPRHKALSYHGDLNSQQRADNLDAFRNGEESILIGTDIAARGIDIPEIDQIIMFDFPLNPVDYIHRAGRCGRAGRKGKFYYLLLNIIMNRRKPHFIILSFLVRSQ